MVKQNNKQERIWLYLLLNIHGLRTKKVSSPLSFQVTAPCRVRRFISAFDGVKSVMSFEEVLNDEKKLNQS